MFPEFQKCMRCRPGLESQGVWRKDQLFWKSREERIKNGGMMDLGKARNLCLGGIGEPM
jgi:hypothetical protein